MLGQVLVREFSSLSEACFRDFQRAAAESWDFPQISRGHSRHFHSKFTAGCLGVSLGGTLYLYFLYIKIYFELEPALKNFKLRFTLNFVGIAVISFLLLRIFDVVLFYTCLDSCRAGRQFFTIWDRNEPCRRDSKSVRWYVLWSCVLITSL